MESQKKAVLVDRDDTLCPDVPYCSDPSKIHVFTDVPASIKKLNDAGFLVIIVTNQSGIGRGYFSQETLEKVNSELISQINSGGGRIDDVFFCPHTPEDNCDCRKPKIGMGVRAISKYNLNPDECWMIGDHQKDIDFGTKLGMRTIQVSKELPFSKAVEIILTPVPEYPNAPTKK